MQLVLQLNEDVVELDWLDTIQEILHHELHESVEQLCHEHEELIEQLDKLEYEEEVLVETLVELVSELEELSELL